MMNKGRTVICAVLGSILISISGVSQETDTYNNSLREYRQAKELFYKKKFSAARDLFASVEERHREAGDLTWVNADYYHALSCLELFNRDAEYHMKEFVKVHPESKWVQPAYYHLGNYNFRRNDYDEALTWFDKVEELDLAAGEQYSYHFKRGFSAFSEGEDELARNELFKVKDDEGEYYGPANYYYGHIAYEAGNYQDALSSFQRITDDESFGAVVPYYIAQIYYKQGKYEELLEYAPPLLDSTTTDRDDEISRLVGDAFYKREEYAEAYPYLKDYLNSKYDPSREEFYQTGYAAYRAGKYEEAIKYLSKASEENDELGQTAAYQLADAYVKLDRKKFARNAFKVAANMNVKQEITEDALFNYAKLAYELSFDPYDEAIKAFENYLESYPSSSRRDEAYEFLLKVYLKSKNWNAALSALEKIQKMDARHESAYQVSAFNLGVQRLQQGNAEQAIDLFKRSRNYQRSSDLVAKSYYWQGEAEFKLQDYSQAVAQYRKFQNTPGAYNSGLFNRAYYNQGYAYFRQEKFQSASDAFRKYINASDTESRLLQDAQLRAGDCLLVGKSYQQAIDYYQQAADQGDMNADYALYQIAMAQGYRDNLQSKIDGMERLIEDYPSSSLSAPANYEAGDAALNMEDLDVAATFFTRVIEQYPNSVYAKKALLRNGLVQYRRDNYDQAIASFKRVMEDYPNDDDSKEAMTMLKNIYVELGRVEDFSNWVSDLPNYNVSSGSLDSLSFQAAENLYSQGNCNKASSALEEYLDRFDPPIFGVNAHYYLAECQYDKGQYAKALENYNYVIERPTNSFTENALLGAATLNYRNSDYQAALEDYKRLEEVADFSNNVLEAQIGQLRCAFELRRFEEAIPQANAVIENSNTPEDIVIEARLLRGKMHLAQSDSSKAMSDFQYLVENTKSSKGAEAQYRIAFIKYHEGKFAEAEESVFNLVQNFASYGYWKTRSFILLGDIYRAMDDLFQAKATLRSVIENAREEDLVQLAKNKLEEIKQMEDAERTAPADSINTDSLDEGNMDEMMQEPDTLDGR